MKRIFALLLALTMVLSWLPGLSVSAQAATIVASGEKDEYMQWKLDSNGTLTLSGTSMGYWYDSYNPVPWSSYRSMIKKVVLQEGISNIADNAFSECASLQSVSIPNTVREIGWYAFRDCSNLQSVDIPDGVTTIGDGAFSGCTNLKSVHIPDSVYFIDYGAFMNCSSLTEVDLPDSITKIAYHAFSACVSLESITIPEKVTSIGKSAFESCGSLESVNIPETVTDIGENAFQYCSNLTSVSIPAAVERIGEGAFRYCTDLKSITVDSKNTHYISDKSGVLFDKGKNKLIQAPGMLSGSYTVPSSVRLIGAHAFESCDVTSVKLPSGLICIDDCAFSNCGSLKSITVPDGTVRIGDGAFSNCSSLTSASIPDSVTSIGESAFQHCISLQKITIPKGVSIVERNVFYDNFSLKSMTIPNSVTCIKIAAFSWCGLTSVTIPYSVTRIESNAFSTSNTVKKITFLGDAPTIGDYAFSGITAKAYYPAGNDTWTKRVRQNYGGKLTWVAYEPTQLKIKTQPKTAYASNGSVAKTTVKASGDGLTYQWYVKNAGASKYTKSSVKTAYYSCKMSSATDGRYVKCKITDRYGNSIWSDTVRMRMADLKLTTQPTTKTVITGTAAKFTAKTNNTNVTYQWQYRTSSSGTWKNASASGNKTATLSVPASPSRHGYQYRCKITDSAGNTVYSKIVSLYVLGIKTQPTSKSVKVGATAKFTVSASGRGLSFQWQYRTSGSGSWKNISKNGKDNVYSVETASRHNGYQYRCRITDSAGNVIYSNVVKLTVK